MCPNRLDFGPSRLVGRSLRRDGAEADFLRPNKGEAASQRRHFGPKDTKPKGFAP
jgi:hypothetical protein